MDPTFLDRVKSLYSAGRLTTNQYNQLMQQYSASQARDPGQSIQAQDGQALSQTARDAGMYQNGVYIGPREQFSDGDVVSPQDRLNDSVRALYNGR